MKLGYTKKILILLTLSILLASSTSISVQAADNLDSGLEPDATKLKIATRHSTTITGKYAQYFAASDLAHSVGITSPDQIEFTYPSTYAGFLTSLTSDLIDADVGWGGGPTLFNQLAVEGALRTIEDVSLLNWINSNISDTLAGAQMKHYDESNGLKWVAAAISSFGFTVNNKTLEERNLPFPTTWDDLASPEFFTSSSQTNIAMGNAPDTTSNTRIYQIILQNYGWEKGWEILYSMAGNSEIFGGSTETRGAVERGDVAAAMTIDFYGVISMNVNPNTQYVIPEGSSIVNGDPIAISSNSQRLDAARAFMKYVLSSEGQALWSDNRINRLPARSDAFDFARTLVSSDQYITESGVELIEGLYQKTLDNQGIEFDEDLALSLEETMRWHFEATITNVHTELRGAWNDIARNYNGGAFPEGRLDQLIDLFGDPAITQQEAQDMNAQIISDASFEQQKIGEWETFASQKYAKAKDAVDDPYRLTDIIVTTDENGNTYTSTITSEGTADTISDNIQNLPINFEFVFVALIAPILISKFLRKQRKH